MKYIAVIGCSFTAHDQAGEDYPEQWNSWSQHIAKDFPNVEVHNYGCSAMATNYFETLLKSLANFKHYKYDAVIIQTSSPTRWALPLDTPTEHYIRYNDFWNTEVSFEEDILVVEHETPTNIPNYKHMIDLTSVITFGGGVNETAQITGIRHNKAVDKKQLQYLNNLVWGGLPLTNIFYYNFLKTLPMYEKYFDKVFQFEMRSDQNNIGKDIGAFEMLEKSTTNISKYTRAKYDDPGHLNADGNKLLYMLYIKHSAIGDWLHDQ